MNSIIQVIIVQEHEDFFVFVVNYPDSVNSSILAGFLTQESYCGHGLSLYNGGFYVICSSQ